MPPFNKIVNKIVKIECAFLRHHLHLHLSQHRPTERQERVLSTLELLSNNFAIKMRTKFPKMNMTGVTKDVIHVQVYVFILR